jgi:hypothetical protein
LSKSIEKNEKENTKKKLKLDVIEEIKENIHFMILIRIYCRDLK